MVAIAVKVVSLTVMWVFVVVRAILFDTCERVEVDTVLPLRQFFYLFTNLELVGGVWIQWVGQCLAWLAK